MRALLCALVCASASVGYGAILTPGGPAGPEGIAPTGTVIASHQHVLVASNNLSALLNSQVIEGDTTNPLGGLTFTFQISGRGTMNPTPPGNEFRFLLHGFEGLQVDGSHYYVPLPPNSDPLTSLPRMVPFLDNNGLLRTRGMEFPPGLARFFESSTVVLRTDATDYDLTADFQRFSQFDPDFIGPITDDVSFAPVPEPSAIVLSIIGLLSLAAMRGYGRS